MQLKCVWFQINKYNFNYIFIKTKIISNTAKYFKDILIKYFIIFTNTTKNLLQNILMKYFYTKYKKLIKKYFKDN